MPGGRASTFQGGEIVWSPATGAEEVHGTIAFLYGLAGGPEGFLGLPVTDENATPGGAGRVSEFQGGSIYWSPRRVGTWSTVRSARCTARWAGRRRSSGCRPVERARAGGGRVTSFQGGEIYWSPATGAHDVHGAIAFVYWLIGGPTSFLGFPLTNESVAPDGVGRYNHFQGGVDLLVARHRVRTRCTAPSATSGPRPDGSAARWATRRRARRSTPDGVGRFNRFQGGSDRGLPTGGAFRTS